MAKNKKNKLLNQFLVWIAVAIGSWAIFSFFRILTIQLLENVGIVNELAQYGILAGAIIVILGIFFGIRGAINKISN